MPEEPAVTDAEEVSILEEISFSPRLFKRQESLISLIKGKVFENSDFCFSLPEKTTEAKMMKAGGTEIGKTLAEKSRGLFSANDWQCKTYAL